MLMCFVLQVLNNPQQMNEMKDEYGVIHFHPSKKSEMIVLHDEPKEE